MSERKASFFTLDKLFGLIGILLAVGLLSLPVLITHYRGNAPQYEHVRGLIGDVRAERYDEAYRRMEQAFRSKVSLKRFQAVLARESVLREAEDCDWSFHSVANRTDAVTCTVDRPSSAVKLELLVRRTMHGDRWWVVRIRIDERELFAAELDG